MGAGASPSWEPVEAFGELPSESGLSLVDAAMAEGGLAGRRFQSTGGERAILLPVGSVGDRAQGPISVDDLPDGVTGLLFVDPPDPVTAGGLAGMVGEPPGAIRVTLAEGADPAGLAADSGRVVVTAGPGSTTGYRLYRLDAGDSRKLPPGPGPGEGADAIEQRSKWFTARHGGPRPR